MLNNVDQYCVNNKIYDVGNQVDFDLKKSVKNFLANYIQACTDNKMQGMTTLLSLACITSGLTNGFMNGNFRAVNFGIGLLGMSNLMTGNLSGDDNVSQTCTKVGTIASILFFNLTQVTQATPSICLLKN